MIDFLLLNNYLRLSDFYGKGPKQKWNFEFPKKFRKDNPIVLICTNGALHSFLLADNTKDRLNLHLR